MAPILDSGVPVPNTDHFQFSRVFFEAWQRRNEVRQRRWREETETATSLFHAPEISTSGQQRHFASLHQKIQHLKVEIVSLINQDKALFEQLFALQDAIFELSEQGNYSDDSSEYSTPFSSPCSQRSSFSSNQSEGHSEPDSKRSSSFVRQHVSYPPSARNRSIWFKSANPHHGCQESYDSGIHTSDQEIFV